MYKLLIVDDEELIRSAVSSIIDWNSLGFSDIYQADNGQAALKVCRNNKIDLVLTDIAMPFMDGLALSTVLSKEFPEIHIVILTGHEDFEYAKQSIDLGVKNYILKPVGASTLYQKMKEICQKLHIEVTQKEYVSQMKSQLYQSLPIMREKFLYLLVCMQHGFLRDVEERIKALELPLLSGRYMVGVVEADLSKIDNADIELYLFMTKNIVMDVVGNSHCLFDDNNNKIIIVFNTDQFEDDSHRIIYDTLQVAQMTASSTLKINVTCAAGSKVNGLADLNRSYQEAMTALDCRYSLGYNRVYDINDLDFIKKSFFYPVDGIKELIYSVKFLKKQDIEKCMSNISSDLKSSMNLSAANIKMVFVEIVSLLLKELSYQKEVSDGVWDTGFALYNQLDKMTSIDEAYSRILSFSMTVSEELFMLQTNSGQHIIKTVKEYIEKNYMEESISLTSAADSASVSTGYLSAIFKKETGINFVEYLTNARMEKAKNLLTNTDMKTYEIAYSIGFSNPHYFSISFKKYSGMSPSEYRNS